MSLACTNKSFLSKHTLAECESKRKEATAKLANTEQGHRDARNELASTKATLEEVMQKSSWEFE